MLLALLFATAGILPLATANAQSIFDTLTKCPGTVTGSTAPEQIHLQMGDSQGEMTVMWATESRTGSTVEWGIDGAIDQSADGTEICYQHDLVIHRAAMTGLPPDSNVTYRVGDGGTWSSETSFRTWPAEADRFEWIAIADHGDSSDGAATTASIIAETNASLVTISGDISYADGEQEVWDSWFAAQEPSMRRVPWLTAVGNHENEPGYGFDPYDHRFHNPGASDTEEIHWYSVDLPGVHLVFISTEHDYSEGSEQATWLATDLARANEEGARGERPFVILLGHKPMYSSNAYHGSEVELRDALEEMLVEHGVDLAIWGHDHFYERTWPVANETSLGEGASDGHLHMRGVGPIHIVAGTAGRSAYEELEQPAPDWSAYRETNTYGWMRMVYDNHGNYETLTLTFIRNDDTVADHVTITTADTSESVEDGGFLALAAPSPLLSLIAFVTASNRRRRLDA